MDKKQFENGNVNVVAHCYCEECGAEVTEVITMEDTLATDDTYSNGNSDDMYKTLCIECAWELFETSQMKWQAL